MAVKLGLDAKLFHNTGSYATPTWDEITNVRDLTLNLEAGEADVTTRGNAGWRATVSVPGSGSVRPCSPLVHRYWRKSNGCSVLGQLIEQALAGQSTTGVTVVIDFVRLIQVNGATAKTVDIVGTTSRADLVRGARPRINQLEGTIACPPRSEIPSTSWNRLAKARSLSRRASH